MVRKRRCLQEDVLRREDENVTPRELKDVHQAGVVGDERRENTSRRESYEMQALCEEEEDGDSGEERGFKDLPADLLVEVFRYLPQTSLFEVMQVDRSWESAVREGSALWNRIVVSRKWDV